MFYRKQGRSYDSLQQDKTIKSKKFIFIISIVIIVSAFFIIGYYLQKQLLTIYSHQESVLIKDREDEVIIQKPNEKGYYTTYIDEVPTRFKDLLIKKEDQYFYYHPGLNPVSITRAVYNNIRGHNRASSTITQQLVKILLNNEQERSLKNKTIEAIYALSLETYHTKEEILIMYINSIYFGNQIQGLEEASKFYFDSSSSLLKEEQILQLLATISNPSTNYPASSTNQNAAEELARHLGITLDPETKFVITELGDDSQFKNKLSFELASLNIDCQNNCQLTLDQELSEQTRKILDEALINLSTKGVGNGAVVIIKLPENEILTLVGSPDPYSLQEGQQINMALKPRPIGSTIKPFIYLQGFTKGLRPYSLVEDREYRYETEDSFALYPKNYDYQYHGEMTLHYALANSFNVPTVKVLEFIGLEQFYNFLENDLGFRPVQKLENYQLGIALGGLEMDLLQLTRYFTIFAKDGVLENLNISKTPGLNDLLPYEVGEKMNQQISPEEYIQLVNVILNDRQTGMEQFGLKSNLNLFETNYALKTGTSQNFHDSWIIGYTPDFLVGVWLGNAENIPTEEVSGQVGAGTIWSQVMELLFNSEYNKKTPLKFGKIESLIVNNNLEYGLPNDNLKEHRYFLLEDNLILSPHHQDVFLKEKLTQIPFEARESVDWFIDEVFLGHGQKILFTPETGGQQSIKAIDARGRTEKISVTIEIEEE